MPATMPATVFSRRILPQLSRVIALLTLVAAGAWGCKSSQGGGGNALGDYGDACNPGLPGEQCAAGLTCMRDRGGVTQCLLPCFQHADCAGDITDGATACWKCSRTVADWHCVTPGLDDCCGLACAHVYRDCNMTFTDGGGTPLDEAGCTANCGLGTFDAFCMAEAECTLAGVDACRP